jgi:hypothetical protein
MELGGFEPPTSWVRCRRSGLPLPLVFGFLMRFVPSSRPCGESPIGVDMRRYVGIRALKSVSAQFVEGGLNRDLASDRQRVYIPLMTRTNDEIPSERAERLLADRTRFHLSPEAWDQLLAIMDREARPNRKLAQLFSRPSAAEQNRESGDGGRSIRTAFAATSP